MPEHIDRRRYSIARIFAVTAVGGTVAGWGGGQYPWMLVDQLTIDQAVGADTILAALLVVVALAVVIVLPAFGYLLRLTQTDRVEPNLRTRCSSLKMPASLSRDSCTSTPHNAWRVQGHDEMIRDFRADRR